MKLKTYLEELMQISDTKDCEEGLSDEEATMLSFIRILVDAIDDDLESKRTKPERANLEHWANAEDLDIYHLQYRLAQERYPGDYDTETGPRHDKYMMQEAVEQYRNTHRKATAVIPQKFVAGVFRIFLELDLAQERLYDEVQDYCRGDSDGYCYVEDLYPYFDIYNPFSSHETYDYVNAELIERLIRDIDYANTHPRRPCVDSDGFCRNDDWGCYSGDPDDAGIF